jgi:hypothetical protein
MLRWILQLVYLTFQCMEVPKRFLSQNEIKSGGSENEIKSNQILILSEQLTPL